MTDQKAENISSIPIDAFSNLRITSIWTFLMSVSERHGSFHRLRCQRASQLLSQPSRIDCIYLATPPVTFRFSCYFTETASQCVLLFLLFVGAVVGAVARRAVGVSCCVFVFDCGDLQVLQSSDTSLPAHGQVKLNISTLGVIAYFLTVHGAKLANVVRQNSLISKSKLQC